MKSHRKRSLIIFIVMQVLHPQMGKAFVLRAKAVPLKATYSGALPELRVEEDGKLVAGLCKETCRWRTLRTLNPAEFASILEQVRSVPIQARLTRWYSRAFCAVLPDYQFRFDAENGRVFLGLGDICLGGGIENTHSQELISLLRRELPLD